MAHSSLRSHSQNYAPGLEEWKRVSISSHLGVFRIHRVFHSPGYWLPLSLAVTRKSNTHVVLSDVRGSGVVGVIVADGGRVVGATATALRGWSRLWWWFGGGNNVNGRRLWGVNRVRWTNVTSSLELWHHVAMLNSQHGSSRTLRFLPPTMTTLAVAMPRPIFLVSKCPTCRLDC